MALDHLAVHGADIVGIDDERVADGHVAQRDVGDLGPALPMRPGRHPFCEGGQHGRGAAKGVAFERFAAGKHQDDDGAGQVLAQEDRRDDGDAAEKVRAEFPPQKLFEQFPQQRQPPDHEGGEQGRLIAARAGMKEKPGDQVRENARECDRGDDRLPALP